MSEAREKRIEMMAKLLVAHFNEGVYRKPKACCCVGLGCNDVGCYAWWRFFLRTTSAKDLRHILRVFDTVKDLGEPNDYDELE